MADPDQLSQTDNILPEVTPEQWLLQSRRAPTMQAVNALEDDPEEAAESDRLGQSIGVPGSIVKNDLEEYQRQHKAALTSELFNNNEHLREYVRQHPLGASVSNDDWGQLDAVSQAMQKIGVTPVIDKAIQGFVEHFGSEGPGSYLPGPVERLQHPAMGAIAAIVALGASIPEMTLRTASGLMGGAAEGGAELYKQLTGKEGKDTVEGWLQMASDPGFWASMGLPDPLAHMSEVLEKNAKLKAEIAAVAPHVMAGKPIPVGTSEVVDQIHTEQAKLDLKNLDEAFKESQASATRERSPELFADFIKQHTDSHIGFTPELVRKLYGGKEGEPIEFDPEDGKLGFIKDLQQQLTLAEAHGGDIEAPIADVMAKMDPEAYQELREGIRVRPGGMTLEETKEAGKPVGLEEPQEAKLEDLTDQARLFGKPDKEGRTGLPMLDASEKLYKFTSGGEQGHLIVEPRDEGKTLHVRWIGTTSTGEEAGEPNAIGPAAVRQVLRAIQKEYPEAEQLTGTRVSGARGDRSIDVVQTLRKSAGLEPIFAAGGAREGKAEPGIIPVNAAPYEGEPKEVKGGTQLSPYLNFPLKDGLKQVDSNYLTGIPAVLHEFYKDRLNKLAGDVTVHVAKDADMFRVSNELFGKQGGEYNPAFYNPSTDEIYISDKYASGKFGHDAAAFMLMHEGAHALSVIAMKENPELKAHVVSMMEEVKSYLKENESDLLKERSHAYAFKNEKEFWAQAWSDTGFQHTLSMIPISKELAAEIGLKPSIGKSIYDAFRRIIKLMMQREFPGVNIPSTMVDGLFHLQSKFEQIEAKERGKRLGINEVEGAPPVKPEDTERDLFTKANAIGMTKDQYSRYMDLISKRAAEDLAHQVEQGKAIERERQTKEWKDNFARVREEVKADVRNRPDLAADRLLREGDLHGQKVQRPALDAAALSPEQKALLPEGYARAGGVSPDVVAGLFGYQSGDSLVSALGRLKQERELEGLTPAAHLSKLVDAETERKMRKEYGNLEENILADAKDHVISQTQMDMLHEETLALGQQSGASLPMSKDDFKRGAKELFDGSPLGSHSTDKYLAAAGRAGTKAEQALLEGKPGDAFKAKQQQYISLLLANEAKKLEKLRGQFDRFAKTNSKREIASRPPEYTNWIHDILMRTGNVVRRSVQDLQDAISHETDDTLEKFTLSKNTDAEIWGDDPDNPPSGNVMPVASFLFNKDYRKTLDDMTPEEFRAIFDSLKTIDKNGREDGKLLVRGVKEDQKAIVKAMAERLQASMGAEKNYPPGDNSRSLTSTIGVAMLNVETVMNRADLGNARGMFNQIIIRPIVEGINSLAAMEKKYAAKYRALGDFGDVTKKLDNSILIDPLYKKPADLNRGNLLAIIQNLGNPTQMDKFFRGWGIKKEQQPAFMDWVFRNSTKEDWDRAQKLGDLFEEVFKESEQMYRSISGVAPARIELRPIQTPFGEYPGFYHPLIYDPIRRGPSKMDKADLMEGSGYFAPATAAGYTKQRTGYAAPIQLNFDAIPFKIKTMLNDIAMHPAIMNTAKIFRDPEFKQAMVKYYGKEYEAMLDPWLRSAAGQRAYSTPLQAAAGQIGDFIRENLVTTLIGLNPGTVLKHAPTAAIMSMKEVGMTNFWREFHHMLLRDDDYHFAMTNSEELQRRFRNWQETLTGSQQELFKRYSMDTKFFTVRDMMQRIGAAPVAFSDMLSAVPTWLAKYKSVIGEGLEHGDAVFEANRAVRRAHGSSALTNRPEIMRTGPMGQYLVPFYNFFSTVLQRQYEQAWKAKLSVQGRDLERGVPDNLLEAPNVITLRKDEYHEKFPGHVYKAGLSNLPHLMGGLFAYIIAPAIVEQMVQPIFTKKDSYLTMAAKTLGFGLASSWPVVRDVVNGMMEGRDPSLGLYSTGLKNVEDFYRDLQKGTASMNPQHAAKTIMHFNTLAGTLFGITNNEIGKLGQFTYNWAQGREKPKGLTDIWAGIRHGTMKDLRQ